MLQILPVDEVRKTQTSRLQQHCQQSNFDNKSSAPNSSPLTNNISQDLTSIYTPLHISHECKQKSVSRQVESTISQCFCSSLSPFFFVIWPSYMTSSILHVMTSWPQWVCSPAKLRQMQVNRTDTWVKICCLSWNTWDLCVTLYSQRWRQSIYQLVNWHGGTLPLRCYLFSSKRLTYNLAVQTIN